MRFSRMVAWAVNLYRNFYFVIILFVGLALVYVNTIIDNEALGHIAEAVLVSGVFTTALKTFQFTEVFKEELAKVVTSTEFLDNLKESKLVQLWTDCSQVICDRRFPEISQELFEFVKESYFIKGLEYYYPEIQLTIELDYYNGNTNFVQSNETSVIKIKTMNANPIIYKFGSTIDKVDDLKKEEVYRLDDFLVNGERRSLNPILERLDNTKWRVTQEITLSGQMDYTIIKAETRVESLRNNSDFLSFKVGKLTRRIQFNVKNKTNYVLDYVPFGTVGEFADNTEVLKLHKYDLSKMSTGFVMIGQGFVVLLK